MYFLYGSGESLKPGVNQLVNNIMGHLTTKGFYSTLQVINPIYVMLKLQDSY